MLTLYDLCGADDLRFSPYCFRAKLALAVKGVAYETIPVPFTGISGIGRGSFRSSAEKDWCTPVELRQARNTSARSFVE